MSLVLWSGGCDSTLALWYAAKQAKDRKESQCVCPQHGLIPKPDNPLSSDTTVRAISFVHPQVNGSDQSKKARKKILEKFKTLGLDVQHIEVKIKQKGGDVEPNGEGMLQPLIWYYAIPYLHGGEEMQIGYIRGDDVWHHIAELRAAFAGLISVSGRPACTLSFPLEWLRKHDVIDELTKLELLDLCWYCEGADEERTKKHKPCGKCMSCKTHDGACWVLKQDNKQKVADARLKFGAKAGELADDSEDADYATAHPTRLGQPIDKPT